MDELEKQKILDSAKNIMDETQSLEASNPGPIKKRPVMQTVVFGSISICAYLLLFKNESLVTNTFTMGGWHAVFPVGAAFFFSFIHGAFASNLLSVLGLEAKK